MEIKEHKFNIIFLAVISAAITWVLNHKLGYGAIVSNGLVGVIAGLFLPKTLAGTTYAASFVGMSGINVISSVVGASLGGIVIGIVLANTQEIYAGLGGKGGTTAALSTLITRTIMSLFGQ